MKRTSKSLASLAIAAMLSLTAVGAAYAVEDSSPDVGSLTVHKLTKTPANGAANGSGLEDGTVNGSPIAGVNFEIKKVKEIDLKTNKGWTDADKVVANGTASLPEGYTFADPLTKATESSGIAKFSDLPLGLYLVTEKLNATQKNIQGIKPFWVTVPITHPGTRDNWVYDVHVYPKNTEHTLAKSTLDADTSAVGNNVKFPIMGSLTTLDVKSLKITDQLDSKLEYVSGEVSLGQTALTATEDYTVTSASNKVTMELTAAGLEKYKAHAKSNPTDKINFTVTAKVKQSGEITNVANMYVNNPSEAADPTASPDPDQPTPGITVISNPSQTKFGGIRIHKMGKDGAGLAGAKFEVYVAHSDDFSKAKKVSIDGVDSWTTPEGGDMTIDGLRYSNFADNAEVDEASGKYNFYWLKEVQAPEGYELLPQPVSFKVTAQAASADTMNVQNVLKTRLPLTGSAAALILTISAGLLAIGGVAVYSKRRKA